MRKLIINMDQNIIFIYAEINWNRGEYFFKNNFFTTSVLELLTCTAK